MKFSVTQETLLKPLQTVVGVVERRQTMAILANVLIRVANGRLTLVGSDLEVELVAEAQEDVEGEAQFTVAGRKLLEICRSLPSTAELRFEGQGDRVVMRAGKARFSLATLPAVDFPRLQMPEVQQTVQLPVEKLKYLLSKTSFAMAQQDVRYYLNGMLLETSGQLVRAVATDGHRLALCEVAYEGDVLTTQQVILPRKSVLEMQRLLGDEGEVQLAMGTKSVTVEWGGTKLTTKLVDGRFPDYSRVIPTNFAQQVTADRLGLQELLRRVAILSNDKFRGVRLTLEADQLVAQTQNPEKEEAEEQLDITLQGPPLEIGFNVSYLLDALNALEGENLQIALAETNASCVVRAPESPGVTLVVMPMRL